MSTFLPLPRPLGVTALACFFVFGTLASGLAVASLLTPGGPLEPIWRLNPRGHEALSHLGTWAPLLLSLVCLACVLSAYGFFTGQRWGYRIGIALLVINLTGDLVNAVLGIEPRGVIGVPIVALLLWYLSARKVRSYFALTARGDRSAVPPPAAEQLVRRMNEAAPKYGVGFMPPPDEGNR